MITKCHACMNAKCHACMNAKWRSCVPMRWRACMYPTAEDPLRHLQEIHIPLSYNLQHAQATHKKIADRHRLNSSSKKPIFQVGDRV